jgi:predicted permease
MPDWKAEIREAIAVLNLEPMREAEVVEELSQHLHDRCEEMTVRGMSAQEAEFLLRAELNDGTLVAGLKTTVPKTSVPFAAGHDGNERWFAGAWNDLRYGLRLLRVNPGFACVAIASLALGIGANTTIFQLLDAVRLRSLPVKDAGALSSIVLTKGADHRVGNFLNFSDMTNPLWEHVEKQQQGFENMAAWSPTQFDLGSGGEARHASGVYVSGGFFEVLKMQAQLGRLIGRSDDYRGCGARQVVLSDGFWHRNFGGDAGVVGKALSMSGHSLEVIGVTPANFTGLAVGQTFDVAVPLCTERAFSTAAPGHSSLESPATWWLAVVGRLKHGWTIEKASAQLRSISPGIFADTLPATFDAEARAHYLEMELGARSAANGISFLRSQYEDPLWILLTLSGLVLLIACANLANLMLARATTRQREMALRLALGASRVRLIRQLLAESLLLAGLGATFGVALAQIMSRVLVAYLSTAQNQVFMELSPDWRLLGFAAGLALLTCVLFGLTPAIQASRTDPGSALKASGRGASARRERFLLRRVLVVSQVALSLVLLTGAVLFVRTFRNLMTANAGFRQDHVLVTYVDFSMLHVPMASRLEYQRQMLERARAIPGVVSASNVYFAPLSGALWNDIVDVLNGGPKRALTNLDGVGEGYFKTMDIPLLAGRDFTANDGPNSPLVVVVNQAFVRKYLGDANPIGRVIQDYKDGKPDKLFLVVGLVGDTKFADLREDFQPLVYRATMQEKEPGQDTALVIRSQQPVAEMMAAVKRLTAEMNPSMVLQFNVLETTIRDGLLRERLMATLSGFFGVLAAILAMIGLYGVISYMVMRRRNEIGVRMALGANRENILCMVMREAVTLLGIGLVVGAGIALAAGSAAESMLYGLKARDPLTLGMSIAGMAVVALIASVLPAQRAAAVNPMVALRDE